MTTPVSADLDIDYNAETALNAGWITREDAALKTRLQGLYVAVANEEREEDTYDGDDDAPLKTINSKRRKVPVFFRLPEDETRRQTYPYITIDFLTPQRDVEREHRGYQDYGTTDNAYTPMGMPVGGGRGELPIPFTLIYQITQWTRYARHDREIMTQLMFDKLEPRFGYLEMVATAGAPDDNTVRRLDLLSGPTSADVRDPQGKRLFRKIYTVGVSSELFPSELKALAAVGRLVIDVAAID